MTYIVPTCNSDMLCPVTDPIKRFIELHLGIEKYISHVSNNSIYMLKNKLI